MRDDKPSVLCEQEGVDPIPQAGQDNPAASNLYKGSDTLVQITQFAQTIRH